jgi:hypothetical protein
MLLIQAADFALGFALANAGKSILANIAMMAITTKSSISVNAGDDLVFISLQLSILHPSCSEHPSVFESISYPVATNVVQFGHTICKKKQSIQFLPTQSTQAGRHDRGQDSF